jgi:hypothetical protein
MHGWLVDSQGIGPVRLDEAKLWSGALGSITAPASFTSNTRLNDGSVTGKISWTKEHFRRKKGHLPLYVKDDEDDASLYSELFFVNSLTWTTG